VGGLRRCYGTNLVPAGEHEPPDCEESDEHRKPQPSRHPGNTDVAWEPGIQADPLHCARGCPVLGRAQRPLAILGALCATGTAASLAGGRRREAPSRPTGSGGIAQCAAREAGEH